LGKGDIRTLTILGDKDGTSCYKSLSGFSVGETYAFALAINNGSYYLMACGEYSVKIEGGQVKGIVDDSFMIKAQPNSWPLWNQKTMQETDFYKLFEKVGKVYPAPCKSAITADDSNELTMKLEKAKEELKAGKSFDYYAYRTAVNDNNLRLVQFYIENTTIVKHEKLADLVLYAVEQGYIDILKTFLDHGVSPNLCSKDSFFLVYRAVLYPELLKELHIRGAVLNPKGYGGTTTIMHAAREGCVESINYLLENGADLNAISRNGKKAIDYAEYNKRNKEEVIKLLKRKK